MRRLVEVPYLVVVTLNTSCKWTQKNNNVLGVSPGDPSEKPVTKEKRKKGWRMRCDVGEATEGLENEL